MVYSTWTACLDSSTDGSDLYNSIPSRICFDIQGGGDFRRIGGLSISATYMYHVECFLKLVPVLDLLLHSLQYRGLQLSIPRLLTYTKVEQ